MTDATDKHWLVWAFPDLIGGCQCGFQGDNNVYGDSVVKHLFAVGWEEGYFAGMDHERLGDYPGGNPYA